MERQSEGLGDPVHLSPVLPAEDARTVLINTVSWGAVLAGVVIALVTHALLTLAGLALGLALLEPTETAPDASAFSVGAGIWMLGSGIVAAFAGGVIAGRLAGRPKDSTCGLHGLAAWAVATLIVLGVASSAIGALVGGGAMVAAGLGGAVASEAAELSPLQAIERRVGESTAGAEDPAALQSAAVSAVAGALTADEAAAPDARERAVQALARAQGIPVEQARQQYDALAADFEEAQAAVEQAAEEAAEVGARAAIFAFAALVLGGVAGWVGGRLGTVRPTVTPV